MGEPYNDRVDRFLNDAESTLADIKSKANDREAKRQRAGLVRDIYHGMPDGSEKRIELKDEDVAFLNLVRGRATPSEMKALVEDATGRQLVSPAIDAELHRAIADLVVVRQLANIKTTDKDRVMTRTIDEAEVAYGKLETGSEVHESTPAPVEVPKYIEDINGLVKIGIDQLEDSDNDLAAYLVDSFARAVAALENQKFLYGAGHDSGEPEGLCVDATLVAAAVTTAAAGAIGIEDCLDAIYEIPAQYRKGSSWIVNSLTELQLRKLRWKDAAGTYEGGFLWQPSVIAGAPAQFLGYSILTDDNLGTLAGAEEVVAVFGNIRLGYQIYDRRGISVEMLREIYREAGLYGYILHARNTGFPIRPADKRIVLLKEHA